MARAHTAPGPAVARAGASPTRAGLGWWIFGILVAVALAVAAYFAIVGGYNTPTSPPYNPPQQSAAPATGAPAPGAPAPQVSAPAAPRYP